MQAEEMISPGIRVVRGPDWEWDDQDGGEGHVGTVTEVGSAAYETFHENCVVVLWDNGSKNLYRTGNDNSFDLHVLDNAPSGVKHTRIACDSCNIAPIQGIRWKCGLCFDYDLCSQCYHGNEHDITHFFWRCDNHTNKRYKVPTRCGSDQFETKGIFAGAVVSRGQDWEWGDEDAEKEANGVVLNIKSWSDTANSAADVRWANGKQNDYRVGFNGKVDLKFVTATSAGHYYKDHLPILGKVEVSTCHSDNPISASGHQRADTSSVASHWVNTEAHSEIIRENQRLAAEIRQLKEQRLCIMCMDLEACVTFVPCGHLVSCDKCYTGLTNCPICRGKIESIVRTFIP